MCSVNTSITIQLSAMSTTLEIQVDDEHRVTGLLDRPRGARWLYVLAHGAGAGMTHPFLENLTRALTPRGVAVLRYQFPYMEAGKKPPDRAPRLTATVRAALATARRRTRLPLVAGGKSMGGRMTSLLLAAQNGDDLKRLLGLAFVGFPLHAPGRAGVERAAHLKDIKQPMLFLQGTRDSLADLTLMRQVSRGLGRRGKLHPIEGGDHSFHMLKRSGRTDAQAMQELVNALVTWGDKRCAR